MAATINMRLAALGTALLLALSGCASNGFDQTDRQQRERVGENLEGLKQGLQAGTWSQVERFFSPGFHGGYSELRDRLEDRFRNEQITDLHFTVNRVLESDGLVNAQVRWHKTWVDKAGNPGKASGISEFVLKPDGRSYRILQITGDRLF